MSGLEVYFTFAAKPLKSSPNTKPMMHASTLHSPNAQQLSDAVIGAVAQRTKPTFFDRNAISAISSDARWHHPFGSYHPSVGAQAQPAQLKAARNSKNATRPSEHEANARAAAELRRCRERNRVHQARYKAIQKQRMEGLETCIQQLQGEVQELQMQRQVLSLTMPRMKTPWSVAAEYFQLFRFGVQSSTHSESSALCSIDPAVQRDFLQSTMASDVTDGHVRGVDAIMENWTRMSLYNPGLAIRLTRLEEGPTGSVIATTKQTVTITEAMLRVTFPHLVGVDNEISPLGEKFLDQELQIDGSVHFEWDGASNKVSSFVSNADMLTPMLKLLGTLDDVSRVFEGARLTPDFGLVAGDDP